MKMKINCGQFETTDPYWTVKTHGKTERFVAYVSSWE